MLLDVNEKMVCDCFYNVRHYIGCGTDKSIGAILLGTEALFPEDKFKEISYDQYQYVHTVMRKYHVYKRYLRGAFKIFKDIKNSTGIIKSDMDSHLIDIYCCLNIRFVKDEYFITAPSQLCCKVEIMHYLCALNAMFFRHLSQNVDNNTKVRKEREVWEFAAISAVIFMDYFSMEYAESVFHIGPLREFLSHLLLPIFKIYLQIFKMIVFAYNEIWFMNNKYATILSKAILEASAFMSEPRLTHSGDVLLSLIYEIEDRIYSNFDLLQAVNENVANCSTVFKRVLVSFITDMSFLIDKKRRCTLNPQKSPLTIKGVLDAILKARIIAIKKKFSNLHLYGCYYLSSSLPSVKSFNPSFLPFQTLFATSPEDLSSLDSYLLIKNEKTFFSFVNSDLCTMENLRAFACTLAVRLFFYLKGMPISSRVMYSFILFFEEIDSSRYIDRMSKPLLGVIVWIMLKLLSYQATAKWVTINDDSPLESLVDMRAKSMSSHPYAKLLQIVHITNINAPKCDGSEVKGSPVRKTLYEDAIKFMKKLLPVWKEESFHNEVTRRTVLELAVLCEELFLTNVDLEDPEIAKLEPPLDVFTVGDMFKQIKQRIEELKFRNKYIRRTVNYCSHVNMLIRYTEEALRKKALSLEAFQSLLYVLSCDKRYERTYQWNMQDMFK